MVISCKRFILPEFKFGEFDLRQKFCWDLILFCVFHQPPRSLFNPLTHRALCLTLSQPMTKLFPQVPLRDWCCLLGYRWT